MNNWTELKMKEVLKNKLGPYKHPVSELEVMYWINDLMRRSGACKIGGINGYKDQWLIGTWYEDQTKLIHMSFCQGRNVGRIKGNGGYEVCIDIRDCDDIQDIWFKFTQLSWTKKDKSDMIRSVIGDFVGSITSNEIKILRSCIKKLHWMGFDLKTLKGKCKMSEDQKIEELRQKVVIALKNNATPALAVCEEIRKSSPENAEWLDKTYLDYKRPEMVGDDKDGLVAILKSGDHLKNGLANCKASEIVMWMNKIKNVKPVREEEGSINLEEEEKK